VRIAVWLHWKESDFVGLKDATGDISRAILLMGSLPTGFALYSRDDPTAAALILLGAQGSISVTANVIPATMARLCAAARTGDVKTVREISLRIAPLHAAMFVEANSVPVRWALAQMGKLSPFYRLPLTPLSMNRHAEVRWPSGSLLLPTPAIIPTGETKHDRTRTSPAEH
jgi:4-hydroxy-tetrahydrodipicolinate synthase